MSAYVTNPIVVQDVGIAATPITVTKDQSVTINATNTAIAAARATRTSLMVVNTGTVDVFVANGATATTSKFPLKPGDSLTVNHTQAVNGIVSSGTGTVYVIEEAR